MEPFFRTITFQQPYASDDRVRSEREAVVTKKRKGLVLEVLSISETDE